MRGPADKLVIRRVSWLVSYSITTRTDFAYSSGCSGNDTKGDAVLSLRLVTSTLHRPAQSVPQLLQVSR
jgi:hypothetical protein